MIINILRWISSHYFFVGFILLLIILPLFLPSSWIEKMKDIIKVVGYIPGLLILGFLLILATVVAPVNTFSLVPFASITFGWPITTLVLIISWTIGAVIAFLIARRFGKRALSHWQMFKEAENYSNKIPHNLTFFGLVFLRMLIPVDVLSYAVGFFSNISLGRYTLATLIGVTPFSFIWSYGGGAALSKEYFSLLAIVVLAALIALTASYFYQKGKSR